MSWALCTKMLKSAQEKIRNQVWSLEWHQSGGVDNLDKVMGSNSTKRMIAGWLLVIFYKTWLIDQPPTHLSFGRRSFQSGTRQSFVSAGIVSSWPPWPCAGISGCRWWMDGFLVLHIASYLLSQCEGVSLVCHGDSQTHTMYTLLISYFAFLFKNNA